MSCQINIKKKRAILNKYDNTSEISIFTETPPHSSRFFFMYIVYIYIIFLTHLSLHLTLYSQITFTELYLRLLQLSHTYNIN